ncbi:hypothetical protein [Pontibacter qinzhouensis]|uniref:hypothetical protein n=1 Tax=Pontibacter qinzhouensis TaxID=2603253 RepID=UPI0016509516|nr:hypothetical protein [Pontibacter qinzhouensis]
MIHLNPGERILDESKFVARNKSYSEHMTKYAKQTHTEKLERYYQLKNDQKK